MTNETTLTDGRAERNATNTRLLSHANLAPALTGLSLFLLSVGLFALVQWATAAIPGNDGYYHIKMAQVIRQEGLKPAFDALPLTILNAADYYDHHLFFHLYLALFAPTNPAVDGGVALTHGAKLATVLLPSLAIVALWWLLRAQRVPYAALWAVGLFAVSEAFLYRMSMVRAQSGAVVLLILGLHWLLTGRYRLLAPLGFAFVWFYNAFPLLLILCGVYALSMWLLERRVVWAALAFPLLGVTLGLIINPYFPEDLTFIAAHLLPKVGESTVPVGNEWSPYESWTLVRNSGPALAAVLLGTLALGWREERIDAPSLVALGLVGVFGLMLFRSRRFVEYFPVFALVFLAFTSAPLVRAWVTRPAARAPMYRALLPLALLLALAVPLAVSVRDARALVADSKPADLYADAAMWLGREAPAGSMVFQTDWDDFTRLFYYAGHLRYTAGLDPTFMQLHDEALYNEWVDITRGRVERPGRIIAERFGAKYVFSDLDHTAFLRLAAADPNLYEVYRDEYAVIFAVQP